MHIVEDILSVDLDALAVADGGLIEAKYMGLIKISASIQAAFISFYDSLRSHHANDDSLDQMHLTDLLQHFCNENWQLRGVTVKRGWMEVDSVADLEICKGLWQCGGLKPFCAIDEIMVQ